MPVRSWLLKLFLAVVVVGVLAAIARPNFIRSGPSKIQGIINMLRSVDGAKEQWAWEHAHATNVLFSKEVIARDIAAYFTHVAMTVDKDGNLCYTQGVVFVLNPLGVAPEARFTKPFNLSRDGGFFSPKIPKGTIIRFSTNDHGLEEYILPGQESKPCKSLSELLERK